MNVFILFYFYSFLWDVHVEETVTAKGEAGEEEEATAMTTRRSLGSIKDKKDLGGVEDGEEEMGSPEEEEQRLRCQGGGGGGSGCCRG